ncbi:hypothetical protein K435DRAFT_811180, partial [Dendrothele bispora CBS 962.96]
MPSYRRFEFIDECCRRSQTIRQQLTRLLYSSLVVPNTLLNNLNVAPPPPTTFFTTEECTPTPPPTPFEDPTPTDSGFIPSRPPSVTSTSSKSSTPLSPAPSDLSVVPPVHLSVTNPELSNIPSSTTQEIPGASSPETPASTMSAKPAMPVPKGQGAPTLSAESAKDPELVVEYIESVEALLKRSNITDDATKIEWLLRYLDLAVRRMWKMLFDQLKAEVKTYQACRDLLATYYPEIDEEAQNTLARFRKSLREFRDISETDERGLGVYRIARIIDRLFTLGKEIKNEKGGVKDPEHMYTSDDIIKTAVELASRHKPQSAIRGGVGLEQASRSDHVISGSDGLRAVKKEVMQIKSDLAETRAEIKTSNQNNEQLFKKSTTQLQETRKDFEERMLSLKQSSEKEWRNRMEEQNSTWQRQLQQMSWQMHPYQAPTLATPVGYSQSYVPQLVPQVASAQYAQQRPGGGAPAPPQPQFNAGNQRLPSANDNCFFCGVKGHVLANCLELSMYISKGLCQMQGKFVKTVRGDTPPGAGEPGVTLKERLDKFNAANNVPGVAVTVQSVNVAYTRDTYEMEELREALREKERETAQYRQAQVSSQFMNGAAAYQSLPDHPGMKPPENDPDTQSKEKVGSKPPAKALGGRADDREEPGGVEKKTPYKYKIPQKKFNGVELEPTVNGRRVPAAPFQGVKDVT